MSDPYRDSEIRDGLDAPSDRGIVGDVIAQFADPHAFYRELVQNSIDAGSPEISVDLVYDDNAQRMRVSVRDRGEGMNRDIIENQLLVLFRSSKEREKGKIGKFGVGFASVLSPGPEVVVVTSAREGKKLTLHLYRDLSFELFDAGRATQNGTTVELEIAITQDAAAEFERLSHAALRRWCRHASVPITFSSHVLGNKRQLRIDGPLAFEDSLVEVTKTLDGGELTIVAAIAQKPTAYLGFFNHGLMLYESDARAKGFPNVQVKVQDSRLGHTISRDDVRRDGHYHRALAAARRVATEDLAAAAEARMRELADNSSGPAYAELLEALAASEVPIETWHLPLVEPIAGKLTIGHDALAKRVWYAPESSPLTQALAAAGVPVVRAGRRDMFDTSLQAALTRIDRALAHVEQELTAVTLVEPADGDTALVELLRDMLDHAHRAPAGIVLAELAGARDDLVAVSLGDRDTRVLDSDDATKNPFALLGRRTLALSVKHPHVAAAREADDPTLAASHLARAILLQYGLLDRDRSHTLLEQALDRLGVGS